MLYIQDPGQSFPNSWDHNVAVSPGGHSYCILNPGKIPVESWVACLLTYLHYFFIYLPCFLFYISYHRCDFFFSFSYITSGIYSYFNSKKHLNLLWFLLELDDLSYQTCYGSASEHGVAIGLPVGLTVETQWSCNVKGFC